MSYYRSTTSEVGATSGTTKDNNVKLLYRPYTYDVSTHNKMMRSQNLLFDIVSYFLASKSTIVSTGTCIVAIKTVYTLPSTAIASCGFQDSFC